jgi:hypothetical protein
MSYRPIPLTQEDSLRLRVRARRKVPYNELCELLVEGHEVFIPEMNKNTAFRARKILSKMLGCEVQAYPSELKGQSGYTFKVSLVQEYLKRVSQQES